MKISITARELKNFIASKIPLMILDVRSRQEYEQLHIPIAGNLSLLVIEEGSFIPEPGKIIITVCGKGAGRSERAASFLRTQFSCECYFLEGGTFGWDK